MDQEGRPEQYSILKVPNIAWIDRKGAPPHNDGLVVSSLSLHSNSDAHGYPREYGTGAAHGNDDAPDLRGDAHPSGSWQG